MTRRKPIIYDPTKLLEALEKLPNPLIDKKHNLSIYIDGRARSNQTRAEHIVEYGHDLKARDIELIQIGISNYFKYKKDSKHKNTFNYYIKRKGSDKGFVKVSIKISNQNKKRAWVKTIFIAYKIK